MMFRVIPFTCDAVDVVRVTFASIDDLGLVDLNLDLDILYLGCTQVSRYSIILQLATVLLN